MSWALEWSEIETRAREEMQLVRDHLKLKSEELTVSDYLRENFPEILATLFAAAGAARGFTRRTCNIGRNPADAEPFRITYERFRHEVVRHAGVLVFADDHSRDRVINAPLWPYPPYSVISLFPNLLLQLLPALPEDLYVFDSSFLPGPWSSRTNMIASDDYVLAWAWKRSHRHRKYGTVRTPYAGETGEGDPPQRHHVPSKTQDRYPWRFCHARHAELLRFASVAS